MTDTRYNGWTNYATWRVNLEICDDYCGSLASDVENGYQERFADIGTLAESLKESVEALVYGDDYHAEQLVTQYAMAFIDDVNWDEIARHWEPELIASDDEDEDEDEATA